MLIAYARRLHRKTKYFKDAAKGLGGGNIKCESLLGNGKCKLQKMLIT